jgi:hypothetical protein
MKDLDLRAALHDPAAVTIGTLDLDHVMTTGRRVRRRRRLLGAATVAAVAAVAVLAGGVWTGGRRPEPGNRTGAVTAGPTTLDPASVATALGDTIPAGDDLVFFVAAVDTPTLPGITFGVMAGHRDASGNLRGDVFTNEVDRPERASGFHAFSPAKGLSGREVPAFGYFVGPAARVYAVVGGRRVEATLARWSRDPRDRGLLVRPGRSAGRLGAAHPGRGGPRREPVVAVRFPRRGRFLRRGEGR